jgi:hypothetical protein
MVSQKEAKPLALHFIKLVASGDVVGGKWVSNPLRFRDIGSFKIQ